MQSARYFKLGGPDLQSILWRNQGGVSSQQFRQPVHILFRNMDGQEYVLMCRPIGSLPAGCFYMNEKQRQWARVGMNDTVQMGPYEPSSVGEAFYIGGLDLNCAFAVARDGSEDPMDEKTLIKAFTATCADQVLQPGQKILVETGGAKFLFTVKSIKLAPLGVAAPPEQDASLDPRTRGLFYVGTPMKVVSESPDPRFAIKIKYDKGRSSAKPLMSKQFKFSALGIGGLDDQSDEIFRRAFLTRTVAPEIVQRLQITHLRGMLLFGPPGTGKTLIARKIGEMLNAREPKVINGPEVLNKFVGQSEENIRKVFEDAEKEQKEKGDESGLHVIIFDELDAVCKARGSGVGGGTGVGDSIVNQLLTKLDGVQQLNNILLIGMTNRKDLIDEALMRPGRLELHVEIGLPDEPGREQIFMIHTKTLRENHVLDPNVDLKRLAKITGNYSGAEIRAVVSNATEFALKRAKDEMGEAEMIDSIDAMNVVMEDLEMGTEKVRPAFGSHEEELESLVGRGIVPFNPTSHDNIFRKIRELTKAIETSDDMRKATVLFHGSPGSGTTAVAAKLALDSGYTFIRAITPTSLVKFKGEMAKRDHIVQIFSDAERSKKSLILLDGLEDLIDWIPVGNAYSPTLVSVIRTLLHGNVAKDRHQMVLVTTSDYSLVKMFQMERFFRHRVVVPTVMDLTELARVLAAQGGAYKGNEQWVCQKVGTKTGTNTVRLGIKRVLGLVELCRKQAYGDPNSEVGSFIDEISEAINEENA